MHAVHGAKTRVMALRYGGSDKCGLKEEVVRPHRRGRIASVAVIGQTLKHVAGTAVLLQS